MVKCMLRFAKGDPSRSRIRTSQRDAAVEEVFYAYPHRFGVSRRGTKPPALKESLLKAWG